MLELFTFTIKGIIVAIIAVVAYNIGTRYTMDQLTKWTKDYINDLTNKANE